MYEPGPHVCSPVSRFHAEYLGWRVGGLEGWRAGGLEGWRVGYMDYMDYMDYTDYVRFLLVFLRCGDLGVFG